MAQNSLPTLEQPTSKLLHEKNRRKLDMKKKDEEVLWVKFWNL
jgi:hypothetical protein